MRNPACKFFQFFARSFFFCYLLASVYAFHVFKFHLNSEQIKHSNLLCLPIFLYSWQNMLLYIASVPNKIILIFSERKCMNMLLYTVFVHELIRAAC